MERQPNPHDGVARLHQAAVRGARLAVAVGAVAVLAVMGYLAWDANRDEAGWLWRDASVELRPVRAIKGIGLGESLREASARAGAFEPEGTPLAASAQSGPRDYVSRDGALRLRLEGGRIVRVSYHCRDSDNTHLNRIGCLAEERRVVEVFGNGARRLCARVGKSDPRRALAQQVFAFDVLDTGTRYVTREGRVRGFVIMDPRELETAHGGDLLFHRCG